MVLRYVCLFGHIFSAFAVGSSIETYCGKCRKSQVVDLVQMVEYMVDGCFLEWEDFFFSHPASLAS